MMTASKITDALYVGDWQDARDTRGSNYIVIVTVAVDSPFVGDYKFDLVDGPAPKNDIIFSNAIETVVDLQKSNFHTLVHCVSGISRSCAVVIGYLMKTKGIDYNDALTEVRKVRPIANPAPFFVDILSRPITT